MGLEDRENAFENKYKHDQELKFRVEARLAKLFGQWIAGQLDLPLGQVDAYAKDMVVAQLDAPGNDDIIDKAEADLKAAGKSLARASLQAKVDQLEIEAKAQIMNEIKA